MTLSPITPTVRQKLKIQDKITGIFVANIERKSLAAKYGIKRGDIINSVNQQAVTSVEEFFNIIEAAKKLQRKSIMLLIYRSGQILFLNIPILD